MKHELRCSFCEKELAQTRKLIAGPRVYICDECVQLCADIVGEQATEETQRQLSRAREELKAVREELKRALSERSDLERVIWLAHRPDASRVAIMARHLANASEEAQDVPRELAERARSFAEALDAFIRS